MRFRRFRGPGGDVGCSASQRPGERAGTCWKGDFRGIPFFFVFCRSSHEFLITVFDDLESIQVVVVVVVVVIMFELRVNGSTVNGRRSTVDGGGLKGVN